MAKRQSGYRKPEELSWASVDREVILKVIELCDGHTIFKPEAFSNFGAPPALVAKHTVAYESDLSDHKATIFVGGKPVTQCVGVYGLDVIEQINDDLGLPSPWQTGRGFRARQCYENIRKHLGAEEVANG
jgi:hypothetical protein